MQRQDVDLPDPADAAAAAQWGRQLSTAVASANARRVRLQQIDAVLGTSVVVGLRNRVKAAAAALAAAQAAADAAAARSQAAESALLDATRGPYADAQNALAAAAKAVADELARLMTTATSSSAVTSTIDGLALRERYRAGTATDPPVWDTATIPFRSAPGDAPFDPEIRLPAVGDADYPRLVAVLGDLDDTVDAVADVVTAESVHHLVGGNLARSSAALEIAASGTVTDEPDVIATPAPGYDLTHRVLVLTPVSPAAAWSAPSAGLVATADPAYAAWLSGLLPDPAQVQVGAAALASDGTSLRRVSFTADALGLDAPGWLRATADAGELAARVALTARSLLADIDGGPWAGPIVLDDPDLPAGRLSLAALATACARVRSVLMTTRALVPGDLAAGVDTAPSGPADASAADTAVAAVHRAQDALADLDTRLGAAGSQSPAELVATLLAAGDAGLAEATPPEASGASDPATLVALATAARARLAARVQLPRFAAVPGDPQATVTQARALLARLCLAPAPLLMPVPAPADATAADDLAGRGSGLADAAPAQLRSWLTDHARVRPALTALLDVHDAADTFGAAARLRPRATQLPREPNATWAGHDPAPTPGLVDLVTLDHGLPNGPLPGRLSGLAVDAWTQTVPASTYDTAVAFHYDEPRGDPPQAVLVAVAADATAGREPATWSLDDLVGTVRSTMALARQRATAADLYDDATVRIGRRS